MTEVDASRQSFLDKIAVTENRISWKFEQLVSLIKAHQSQLMNELSSFKDKLLKEMSAANDELDRQFVIMESFKRYCQEMTDKGTACDICRTANDLHATAEELVRSQEQSGVYQEKDVDIIFTPSAATTVNVRNLIGNISLRGMILRYLDTYLVLCCHCTYLKVHGSIFISMLENCVHFISQLEAILEATKLIGGKEGQSV